MENLWQLRPQRLGRFSVDVDLGHFKQVECEKKQEVSNLTCKIQAKDHSEYFVYVAEIS